MDEKTPTMSGSSTRRQAAQGQVADGLGFGGGDAQANAPLDLGAGDEAPPAYGTLYDQLNLSQAGFNAGAVVTGTIMCNVHK